jgi:hypothetical protein
MGDERVKTLHLDFSPRCDEGFGGGTGATTTVADDENKTSPGAVYILSTGLSGLATVEYSRARMSSSQRVPMIVSRSSGEAGTTCGRLGTPRRRGFSGTTIRSPPPSFFGMSFLGSAVTSFFACGSLLDDAGWRTSPSASVSSLFARRKSKSTGRGVPLGAGRPLYLARLTRAEGSGGEGGAGTGECTGEIEE